MFTRNLKAVTNNNEKIDIQLRSEVKYLPCLHDQFSWALGLPPLSVTIKVFRSHNEINHLIVTQKENWTCGQGKKFIT